MNTLLIPGQGKNFDELLEIDCPEKKYFYELISDITNTSINHDSIKNHTLNSLCILGNAFGNFQRANKRGVSFEVVAGYSVGQYAALGVAGVLDLESCLNLVFERSKMMEQFTLPDMGMLFVLGLPLLKLDELIEEVLSGVNQTDSNFLGISNFNSIQNYSVAGSKALLQELKKLIETEKVKACDFVPVLGAWHSRMFYPAREEMKVILNKYLFKTPSITFLDNVDGAEVKNAEEIKDNLVKHLYQAVQWEKTMDWIINNRVNNCLIGGPGTQLSVMLLFKTRKIKAISINDEKGVEFCAG